MFFPEAFRFIPVLQSDSIMKARSKIKFTCNKTVYISRLWRKIIVICNKQLFNYNVAYLYERNQRYLNFQIFVQKRQANLVKTAFGRDMINNTGTQDHHTECYCVGQQKPMVTLENRIKRELCAEPTRLQHKCLNSIGALELITSSFALTDISSRLTFDFFHLT